jgi:hypothetical protein
MTKLIALGMLSVTLGGCITTEDRVVFNDYYTRSQVDFINAEQQCKTLARTLVQIARCDVRR